MTTTKEARIEISTHCNYRCIFCPHKNGFNRKKEIMSDDLFFKIINKIKQIPRINTITLSGMGEAFTDKNILNKVKYCKDNGYIVNLLTNGSLLTPQIVDELYKLKVDSIRISLHTLDKEEYKQITGADLDNVEFILDYIYKTKTVTRLIVSSDIVNDKQSIEELKKYSEFADVEIWKPHNWINWATYRQGERVEKTCGRPFNGPIQIQVDGTINMCCFDYNGELEIGDFKTQTIDEIFNSDMYLKIKHFHEGNDSDILCSKCDQLYKKDQSILIYSNTNVSGRIYKTSTNYEKISGE